VRVKKGVQPETESARGNRQTMLENMDKSKHRAWEARYAPSAVVTEAVALKYEYGITPCVSWVYSCVKLSATLGIGGRVAGCPQRLGQRRAMFRLSASIPCRRCKGTVDRLPICRPWAHKKMLRRNNGGFLLNPANVLAYVRGRSLPLLWPRGRRKDDWIIDINVR
jgi:hypothetical protein